jgi:type I restriction enzyme M protein
MPLKKSDLYASLWASCDELRGVMDASQYKDYVLFMLFIKYISDKYGNSKNFAPPVIIPKGASFKDMVALKGKANIGDKINTQIIQPLIDANTRLSSSDFANFNDPAKLGEGNEKVERLSNLIAIFENPELNFSKNHAENDDILGDAYEYLMKHFATESGKSKGQFYTPSEVSRVIAKVIGISSDNSRANTTVYDPTCGSGSLLLKVASEAGKQITLEGQEMDVSTAGVARMNMILHDFPTANILSGGSTLSAPKFLDGNNLRTYDYVVANPPFSSKTWSTGINPSSDPYQRFTWGAPPPKQGDYAFLLHIIRSMKSNGKGACILPHGVLFRGNAEAVIRQQLVKSGFLKAVIGLPANLFYGTGIPACILVLDKENANTRKGIFMIDARNGFKKDGPKNRLREQDIHKIIDSYTNLTDIPGYSRMVAFAEISDLKNDFNLNLPRYIDISEPEDIQSIEGHLQGGIPEFDIDALNPYWKVIPSVRKLLFESAGRPDFVKLKILIEEVKTRILTHPEFESFNKLAVEVFNNWKKFCLPKLEDFKRGSYTKQLILSLSEDLLNRFKSIPLVKTYDLYQHLMDYWAETMQDDCYLISNTGWLESVKPREVVKIRNANGRLVWPKEDFDYLKGKRRFKSDLLPKNILISHYFITDHNNIEFLQTQISEFDFKIQEMIDENSGEDGLLDDVIEGEEDKKKITLKSVKARLKEITKDPNFIDEYNKLKECEELLDKHTDLKNKLKIAQSDLDIKLEDKYSKLKEEEIKLLVIEKKWINKLSVVMQSELDKVSQTLTFRIQELAKRYETPLPKLIEEVDNLTVKVKDHLKKMGAVWK